MTRDGAGVRGPRSCPGSSAAHRRPPDSTCFDCGRVPSASAGSLGRLRPALSDRTRQRALRRPQRRRLVFRDGALRGHRSGHAAKGPAVVDLGARSSAARSGCPARAWRSSPACSRWSCPPARGHGACGAAACAGRRSPPRLLLLALLAAAAAYAIPERGNQRSAITAANVRWELARTSLRMTASNPAFGVGIGRFYSRSGEFSSPELLESFPPAIHENAHNNFLQILAELGIVGFAVVHVAALERRAVRQPAARRRPARPAACDGASSPDYWRSCSRGWVVTRSSSTSPRSRSGSSSELSRGWGASARSAHWSACAFGPGSCPPRCC